MSDARSLFFIFVGRQQSTVGGVCIIGERPSLVPIHLIDGHSLPMSGVHVSLDVHIGLVYTWLEGYVYKNHYVSVYRCEHISMCCNVVV